MRRNGITIAGFILMAMAVAVLSTASPAIARDKIIVAVGTFADESGKNLGAKASDAITNTFVKLKYFTIVERNRIDQVMREIAHQQTGFVDESTAIEIGKQLGAKVLVVGAVTSAGYNIEKTKYKDSQGIKRVVFNAHGKVGLNLRMVDVETGQVVFSQTINGTAVSDSFKRGSTPPSQSVMFDKAIQNAAHSFYGPIQKSFPLIGTVVKKDGKWIWIDFGSDWGVAWKRGLIFYRGGGAIRHPKTGEIIGYDREEVARDSVAEVMESMCKAKVSKKEAQKIKIGDTVIAKPEIFY